MEKEIVWLSGEIKTPPFSKGARLEAGFLMRKLQIGELIPMPLSRPMPTIGKRCHELRIVDSSVSWRIVYRIDSDAIVILEIFKKQTKETPKNVIGICQKRLKQYDEI
jgi:phage-related protein